jgi:hypothetical protein
MLSPTWIAILEDGKTFKQDQIPYLDLIRLHGKKLREFRLVDERTGLCGKCNHPVIAPRILMRVRLDPSKRLIYRRRPPLPDLTSTVKADTVCLVGWQQTLYSFTDLRGNPANIQMVSVLNERTGEVHILDRYIVDIGAGTYEPELFADEILAGVRSVIDNQMKARPETGAMEAEEMKDKDMAGIVKKEG